MAIDKLEKIGQDGVFDCITEIINNALGCVADYSTQIRKLFYALKLTQAQLEAEYSNRTQVIDGLHEIIEFQRGLNILGISDYCKFVPSLARGLEVYTGNVWEVFDKDKHISSSLGGGGRYDEIISKFLDDGNMYPAVGMSFGLKPICTVLAAENSTPVPLIDLLVVPMGTQMECIKFANQLRKLGIRV